MFLSHSSASLVIDFVVSRLLLVFFIAIVIATMRPLLLSKILDGLFIIY